MSDDNKQQINPNTNDDFNLDFDIKLDPNQEENIFSEQKKVQETSPSEEESTKGNFDISGLNQTETATEKQINKENIPVKEVEIEVKQEVKQEVNQEIKEDEKIQETPVETPQIETQENTTIPEETKQENMPVEEVKIEINQEEKIETEQKDITENKEYTPDLSSANETILQLQEAKQSGKQLIQSGNLDQIPTIQSPDMKIIKDEIEIEKPITQITSGTINLDDILNTNQEIQTQSPIQESPQQVPFPQSIPQASNPFNVDTQQTIQETTTQNTDKNNHKKHLIMTIAIIGICLIGGFFILKTMYPLQFGGDNGGEDTQIQEEQIENPFQQTEPLPEEVMFTGTQENTGTNENIVELTGTIQEISGTNQEHNSNNPEDPFQDLDNLQTQDEQKKQATLDSLKDFAEKGQYYLNLGKENSSKDMIKYGIYLTGKSTTFINQIENGEILDISSLDPYLAQSSVFLQKLQDLENDIKTNKKETQEEGAESQTGEQEIPIDGSTGEDTQL